MTGRGGRRVVALAAAVIGVATVTPATATSVKSPTSADVHALPPLERLAAGDAGPVLTPTAAAAGCPSSVDYLYADLAEVWPPSSPAQGPTGATVSLSQEQPTLAACDWHSLAEMAVVGPGDDIVEIGWIVATGSPTPHLFVYHWVNGQPSCYNGCGFVQVSATTKAGMAVSVTSTPESYAIQLRGGNWWVGYRGVWFGYFPGSLWNGQFTSLVDVQWFGEVAASSTSPCTDMGSGTYGALPTAATIEAPTATGTTTPGVVEPTVTDAAYYNLSLGADTHGMTVHYGGPGAC